MKNKDKSRTIVKIGVHKHLQGLTLKEIEVIQDEYFKENNLDIRDKAFVKNLTLTSIRNRGILENVIAKYLDRPLPKKLTEIKAILIMGVAQILFTRTEDYAAVNTTVNFFEGRLKKWRGLSNAILRKIIREENYKNKKYELSLNVPDWLYKVWKKQYGQKNTEKIIDFIFKEPTLDLKIKKDFDFWKKEIRGEQIAYNTLRLNKSGDTKKISGYKEGAWWVQNLAAQIPVELMGNIKNEKVLDLCAAPGGKTAQLLNEGAIVTALDISEKKIKKLNSNICRLNLEKNLTAISKDFLKWNSEKKYNKILLDAPCSATGTVRKNPDVLWNKNEKDIERLANTQKKLLDKAISKLSDKGILVYCNCSMQFEEGEKVIDFFIKKNRVKLLPIKPEELKLFPKEIFKSGFIRTLPYMHNEYGGLDGFFIARFVKA